MLLNERTDSALSGVSCSSDRSKNKLLSTINYIPFVVPVYPPTHRVIKGRSLSVSPEAYFTRGVGQTQNNLVTEESAIIDSLMSDT